MNLSSKLIALVCIISSPACGNMTYNIGPWELTQCGKTHYTYSTHLTSDEVDQVEQAFDFWNDKIDKRLWVSDGASDRTKATGELTVVKFVSDLDDDTCGLTNYSWNIKGCITDATINMSLRCEANSSEASFQSSIRHEIGHAIGFFNHSEDESALMYKSIPPYESKPRDLTDDEEDALNGLY